MVCIFSFLKRVKIYKFYLWFEEIIQIKNSSICVLSSKTMIETAKLNGIYKLDESKSFVNNIHYMPDDTILQKLANKEDGTFNLVKYSETIEL